MSRCVSCDDPLSSYEMGLKSPVTGDLYWLDKKCLRAAGLLQDDFQPEPVVEVEEDPYMAISGLAEEFE